MFHFHPSLSLSGKDAQAPLPSVASHRLRHCWTFGPDPRHRKGAPGPRHAEVCAPMVQSCPSSVGARSEPVPQAQVRRSEPGEALTRSRPGQHPTRFGWQT